LHRAVETIDDEGPTVVQGAKDAPGPEAPPWMPVVLSVQENDDASGGGDGNARSGLRRRRREVVGAAAILQGAIPLDPPDPRTIETIAIELREEEDVTTAVVIAGLRRPGARRPAKSG
jgi:hypothetical protein